MKTSERLAAKLVIAVASFCVAQMAGRGVSFAQSAREASSVQQHAPSVNPVPALPTPSLLMEGTGQIAQSSNPCTVSSCSGTFTATLSGRPFGKANLTLNLSVNPAADSFTGCNQVIATGGINDNAYVVNLVGQVCEPGVGYLLSGSVQIYAQAAAAGIAATGTIVAFGGTNIPPNPVPNSGPSLVSIIGVRGKIPVLIP